MLICTLTNCDESVNMCFDSHSTVQFQNTVTASSTKERLYVESNLLGCVIRDFSHGVNDNFALLRYDAASSDKHIPASDRRQCLQP